MNYYQKPFSSFLKYQKDKGVVYDRELVLLAEYICSFGIERASALLRIMLDHTKFQHDHLQAMSKALPKDRGCLTLDDFDHTTWQ